MGVFKEVLTRRPDNAESADSFTDKSFIDGRVEVLGPAVDNVAESAAKHTQEGLPIEGVTYDSVTAHVKGLIEAILAEKEAAAVMADKMNQKDFDLAA